MNRPIRLLPAFMTVGVWTMASRVLGFVRDVMIAAFLGAGPAAEAFFIAFSLPNMFRRLFAEGAFNTAFVPMFSRRLETGGDAETFARDAFSGLAGIVIVLTLVATLAMPWFVLALAGGFAGDARLDLATAFGRVCFPYIVFISLAALAGGVLNATGRFALAAAAPLCLNIVLIAAMAGAVWLGLPVARALVWAVPVAGIAQLALVWWGARAAGISLVPHWPRMTPELRRLAIIAAPAALAGGVVQVNLIVGRQVASFFEGSVAWLWYADRLYQLPLGVVGVAIGIVLLPDLSRRLAADDTAGGQYALNRAVEFSLGLTLPAAVALIVIPLPLVSVLFQRGGFDLADAAATATAVAIYGAGLPAFVLQKVLQPVFFAREDTRSPFRYALASMLVNAALAIGLAPFVGYLAAAVGTTASAWAMVFLLGRGAGRIDGAVRMDDRLRRALPRMALSAVAMGAVSLGVAHLLGDALTAPGLRYAALAGLVLASIAAYGIAVIATGAMTKTLLRAALRRG